MMTTKCPKCHRVAEMQYGGERGEAGPFVYCPHCEYDEEGEERALELYWKGRRK